jgi:O6-methylguanine-DNA--protein-cysteine methyltransferase
MLIVSLLIQCHRVGRFAAPPLAALQDAARGMAREMNHFVRRLATDHRRLGWVKGTTLEVVFPCHLVVVHDGDAKGLTGF